MFNVNPLISRFILFIFIPLLYGVIFLYNFLDSSLAIDQGEIQLTGLSNSIEIRKDTKGVPSILAKTDADAFFAIGYMHAQDRLWQLELQRRIAQGRLSEVFGKDSIRKDILFRTLGLYEASKSSWSSLSSDAQNSLASYTRGINAWLEKGHSLPIEFTLLGIKPEPWSVYDSLSWIKVFSLSLGGTYQLEISRMIAGSLLDKEQLLTMFPHYPDAELTKFSNVELNQLSELVKLQKNIESELKIGGKNVGSNAWVISSKHTKSGKAILSNDPHLGLQIPSQWYAVKMQGDIIDASGMSLVGLPIIIFGRNQNIAWGGTNMMADTQDLYIEQINPFNNAQYKVNDQWLEFDKRTETINVRAEFPEFLRKPLQPITVEVRKSHHGPIITDAIDFGDGAMSLRWTALEDGDTTYEALYQLNYAHDWITFQNALKNYVTPPLNILYSDNENNIGYLGVGKIPVRKKGQGLLPVPAWSNEYEWEKYIPFQEWPRSYNPSEGYIVSANQKMVNNDYPYFISHDWSDPSRANRIKQIISEQINQKVRLDIESMKAIQADTVDISALKMISLLMEYEPQNDRQLQAYKYLKDWRGDMRRDSQAASIFYSWVDKLRHKLFVTDLKSHWNKQKKMNFLVEHAMSLNLDVVHHALTVQNDALCNKDNSEYSEQCKSILNETLNDALWQMYKLSGDWSMESWQWGNIHKARYEHTPFSHTKILESIFERRISSGGSPNSINVSSAYYHRSNGYVQNYGSSFRQVISFEKNEVKQLYMLPTGQSGNVMSPHYDDMVNRFRDVSFFTLASDHESYDESVLLLKPIKQK